jgi:predicted nucleotidyltransferase
MMRIQEEISHNISRFDKLCADHKVKYLYAFGSATTNAFNPSKSDIDLLVDIEISDPLEKGELLIDLWDQFELFFSREVDLLTEESIHNPYLRKSIESTKVLIYDGQREKISF